MPGRDGTGPMIRRGFGNTDGCLGLRLGRGYGCRRGFRRILSVSTKQKEWLKSQKKLLEERLNAVNKQLENC
ncbi:DUF5320 domain-containing protein [Mycoplasmatota bacterium]|nr:DUF5320 domain-containing protein [Mycoplasmatota bacterium]